MIDLLMDGIYTFGALQTLYQNFSRPGASINVNGVNIVGLPGFQVTDITVSQTVSDKAGTATFSLVNCYDRMLHCFNKVIDKVMVLGSKVEVALGYCSVYMPVFKGYISSISWNFDAENGASCRVTCMDARKLMMEDSIEVCYKPDTFKSIMKSVVSPYKELCSLEASRAITDSIEGTLRSAPGQSVYNFIKENLVARGALKKEFFILGERLYYRPARSQLIPIMSVGLGTGLLSFGYSADYLNKEIVVIGYNDDKKEAVKYSKTIKSSEKQSNLYKTKHMIIRADIKSTAEAVKETTRVMLEQKQRKMEGSGSCVGMPQIVPGRFIRITGLDSRVDGLHYITEATHKLSMSGYTTDISIGGE